MAAGEPRPRRDGKKTQDYCYVNGQQLSTAGSLESLTGNFDSGFSSVSEMQRSSPGTYTVQSGDTLQGIARKLWGDPSLWYVLADANGISSNDGLGVGVSLSVPTVNNNVHNNSETFKPYDASKIIGKTEAEPIAPPAPSGCGSMIVSIVVIVVAVIVAWYVAPAIMGAAGTSAATAGASSAGVAAGAGAAGASMGTAATTSFIILPFAMMAGMIVWLTSSKFKKYL